jgi:hypothetical protein
MSSALFTIDRIIDSKYLRCERDENDRRIVNIFLTSKGRAIVKDMYEQTDEQMWRIVDLLKEEVFDGLTDEEISVLEKILEKLKKQCLLRFKKTIGEIYIFVHLFNGGTQNSSHKISSLLWRQDNNYAPPGIAIRGASALSSLPCINLYVIYTIPFL